MRVLRAESGQISNWLVKLVIFVGILGLLAIEGGGVLVAKASVTDTAANAAREAAFNIKSEGIRSEPEEAARAITEENGCEFVEIKYDTTAQTVTVKVRRKAKTYLVQRIGFLRKKYSVATASATRSYAPDGR